jgi:hypothetical protein
MRGRAQLSAPAHLALHPQAAKLRLQLGSPVLLHLLLSALSSQLALQGSR